MSDTVGEAHDLQADLYPSPQGKGEKVQIMEWRIRESGRGGFIAEKGTEVNVGIEAGYKPGCYMPAFIVYESSRFDTRKEAEKYIKSH